MSNQFDPVAKLLNQDENRQRAVRELGAAMVELEAGVSSYKDAYKAATDAGWTKRELNAAGFFDVLKLPKVKKIDAPVVGPFNKDEQ
ncbi:hypothetical protein [Actinomyces sp.]|uniref:hypothetical protein n=1 Tax=Actinomyces sp. TaxID=29317 RepID=UPI00290D6763|nr:hypothetical protein [Actinomyces sp.]MDU5232204.1 hypothetical protein [Actinomyces sp.]